MAALPGLVLLVLCKKTLAFTQQSERFLCRTEYAAAYRLALRILSAGCVLLGCWLLVLMINATGFTTWSFGTTLLEWGALLAIIGIVFGGVLDLLALRKTELL